jgi:hypothetical protein
VLSGGGTTNKRRQIILEFSNHYSKKIKLGVEEPIKAEHKCTFFDRDDWGPDEWNMFFSFMLDCVASYQVSGITTYQHHSVQLNRLRQTTNTDFAEWVIGKGFIPDIVYETNSLFNDFKEAFIGEDSDIPQRRFTGWLKDYANIYEMGIEIKRSNSTSTFKFQAVRR